MKKSLIYYMICWIMFVAMFNVICFITPGGKVDHSSCSEYVFIMVAFVAHFVYACFVFSEKDREKIQVNTPLIIISFFELIVLVAVGISCMLNPLWPNWVGVVACSAVMAFSVIFLVLSKAVGENTSQANRELNAKTGFYRQLTDDAALLMKKAKTDEAKQIAQRVYEAIRYSDMVSVKELYEDEEKISVKLDELSVIIEDETQTETINAIANDLLNLVEYRNNKCKRLKREGLAR